MTLPLPDIYYPVVLWRDGYIYLAPTALELCAHPRSMFADTVRRARAGEWHLVDASGRCFDVVDWSLVAPFGGLKGLGMRLLGSVFAAPLLSNETNLPLGEFKKKLANVVRGRYRYDKDKTAAGEVMRKIHAAASYEAALGALPKL